MGCLVSAYQLVQVITDLYIGEPHVKVHEVEFKKNVIGVNSHRLVTNQCGEKGSHLGPAGS